MYGTNFSPCCSKSSASGRLELDLALGFSDLTLVCVIKWTSAVCCTRINHDLVDVQTGVRSKDPHWTVKLIIRDVRRKSELSERRGAGSIVVTFVEIVLCTSQGVVVAGPVSLRASRVNVCSSVSSIQQSEPMLQVSQSRRRV